MLGDDFPGLRQWQQMGQFFEYKGFPIFYQDSGQGQEVILLIHGFPTSSWDWYKLWPELILGYRVIAPDLIGFGWSAKPQGYPYSIFDQATLCLTLLSHLGIKKVHIIAHDYGDTVTQELLARFQQQDQGEIPEIASVILLNGGLFPESHRARFIQKLLASPLGGLVCRLQTKHSFAKSFSSVFAANSQPTQQELHNFWQLILHNDGKYRFNKLIGYIQERKLNRERWVGALQDALMPLLFINGLDDPISGLHMLDRYRELIPRPEVLELPRIGHYPQVEASDSVLMAIKTFYQRLS